MNFHTGKIFFFFLFLLSVEVSSAQAVDNFRQKIFSTKEDTIHIDSLSIVPNSVSVAGYFIKIKITNTDFSIDNFHSEFIWLQKPAEDSVIISYRVFPFNFTKPS